MAQLHLILKVLNSFSETSNSQSPANWSPKPKARMSEAGRATGQISLSVGGSPAAYRRASEIAANLYLKGQNGEDKTNKTNEI